MTPVPGDAAPLFTPVSIAMLAVGAGCVGLVIVMRRAILRPAALRERARVAAEIPSIRWLLAGLSGWLVWVFASGLAMSALPAKPAPSLPAMAAASMPAYLLGIASVAAAMWNLRRSPAVKGAYRIGTPDVILSVVTLAIGTPIVLAVGTASFVAAELLSRMSGAGGPDEIAHGTLSAILELRASSGLSWWLLPVAIQVVVLAPLLEEVLYRGCLQSALVSATGHTWPSVIAASAIFALIHFPAVPWHALPTLFMVGVVCGLAFERTGRLAPAFLFHAGFNALNLWVTLASAAAAPPTGG